MTTVSFSDDEIPADPSTAPASTPAPTEQPAATPAVEATPAPAAVEKPSEPAPESAPASTKPAPTPKRDGRKKALANLTTEASNGDTPAAEETPPAASVPAPVEPPPELAELNEGVDEKERITPEEYTRKENTRKRFQALLKERSDDKPVKEFGKSILDTCKAGDMSPEEFGYWTKLGVGVKAGDPAAIAELQKILPQAAPAAHGVADPKAPLPAFLQAKVDSFEMAPETAREVFAEMQKTAAPAPTPPVPAPRFPAPPVQQVTQPDAVKNAAFGKIAAIETEYATKYKSDWPKIRDLAFAAIKEAGPISYDSLPGRVRDKIELVVSQLKAKAGQLPPPPKPLTATQTTAPNTPKTGREAALKLLTH